VVAHEHVGIKCVVMAVFIYGEVLLIFFVIRGVPEYLLPLISTGDDVVEGAFVFYAELSRHCGEASRGKRGCQCQFRSLIII
jgi:hypothetical protein